MLQTLRYSLGLQTGFAPHCEQLIVLDAELYFPASHEVHFEAPASDAYVPGLQAVQLTDVDEPTALLLDPAGHASHVEDAETPTDDENFPVVHDTQIEAPTVAEYVPGAHGMQAEARDAPTVVEYFPGMHDMQFNVAFNKE